MADTQFLDDLVETTPDETQAALKDAEIDTKIDEKVAQTLTAKEKGFYQDMKTERQKRQEIQSQLDQLKGTIAAVMQQRTAAAGTSAPDGKKFKGIPVSETEDGELYIPEEQVQRLFQPFEDRHRNLEMVLQQTNRAKNSQDKAEEVKRAIVGEDESFGPAYQKYQAARTWANNKVVEFQKENGMGGPMTPGQALDYVFDEGLEKEFAAKFPSVPLEEIVMAEESQRNFKKMLKSLSKSSDSTDLLTDNGDKLKKLLRKPSGLGSTPNARAGHVSTAEKMSDFSAQDILDLSDAQIEAIHKALRDEEKLEGLSWK